MTISSNRADRRAALLRVLVGRPGPVSPESATWLAWTSMAQYERVVPLLYRLVDAVATDLSDAEREEIVDLQQQVQSWCVQLEHNLLDATRLLAAHGIRSAALKGGATAHLDYPDPSWREFNDVDLLIDPADRVGATAVLAREGWTSAYPIVADHEQYAHAVTLERVRTQLDLHQRIGRRALGVLVPTHDLLDHAVPFEIAGRQLFALDEPDRLIHSALHAAAARYPHRLLATVTDVLVAAESRPHLAPEILARAERWRVRSLVERGVRDGYAAARLDLHSDWAAAMRGPVRRRDRLVDRAYATPRRRPLLEELAYLRLLASWRDRWRYARGYFVTDPEAAARHGRSGVRAQVRYVVSKLRPGRP
jgi:hypothetical protein